MPVRSVPNGLIAAGAALALALVSLAAFAQSEAPGAPVSAETVLAKIAERGKIYFAEAAADLAAAEARLDRARAALFPTATALYEGERYKSRLATVKDKAESYGSIQVTQRLYDFGQSSNSIDAARADAYAAKLLDLNARNTVLMEGLALYFGLHASDLAVQALNQDHASAYVSWERAKEREGLGQQSPIDVAEKLADVEKSRLILHTEQRRNMDLRLRLADLTGLPFDKEMLGAPTGPKDKPAQIEAEPFEKAILARNPALQALASKLTSLRLARDGTGTLPYIEAFGAVNQYSRPSATRDEWTAGARITWPFLDGGRKSAERSRLAAEMVRTEARLERAKRDMARQARVTLRERDNAWQQLIAARARFDYAKKYLLQRQRLYEQERVTDLGRAMINFTEAEADVVRAAGTLHQVDARLAVLLGEHPAKSLEKDFIVRALGAGAVEKKDSYETKGGSGFGQQDQNKVNR
ncbi:MAG: TolC family protein [Rhodospirillaceae bacterium]